jgi:hypothetical protein
MRILISAALALVFSAGAFAQHRGGFGGGRGGGHIAPRFVQPPLFLQSPIPFRNFGSPFGFGNVVFPGTGTQPPLNDPFAFPSSFPARLGAVVSGFPGFTGAPSRFGGFGGFGGGFGGFGFGGGGVIPYPVPVYGGGFDNGYGQQPNVTIVMPPQQQYAVPGAPVTINQNFLPEGSRPVVQEYGPSAQEGAPAESSGLRMYQAPSPTAQAQQAGDDPVTFLIALKDSSVYSAVAYWVQNDALHYVTPQGKHNQVSLSLVDRALSARLNTGRQVEFHLPDGK